MAQVLLAIESSKRFCYFLLLTLNTMKMDINNEIFNKI